MLGNNNQISLDTLPGLELLTGKNVKKLAQDFKVERGQRSRVQTCIIFFVKRSTIDNFMFAKRTVNSISFNAANLNEPLLCKGKYRGRAYLTFDLF